MSERDHIIIDIDLSQDVHDRLANWKLDQVKAWTSIGEDLDRATMEKYRKAHLRLVGRTCKTP